MGSPLRAALVSCLLCTIAFSEDKLAAQDTTHVSVCVLQNGELTSVAAAYNPRTGDTTGIPPTSTVLTFATTAEWFTNNQTVTFGTRRYVKYGLPRVVRGSDIAKIGDFGGVPVFAEPGANAVAPEVLFVPVGGRCELQPYQLDAFSPVVTHANVPERNSTDVSRMSTSALAAYLTAVFTTAGDRFNVPSQVLSALAYVETGWEHITADSAADGEEAAYGMMALNPEEIAKGAQLADVGQDDAKAGVFSNTLAAAALLSAYADSLHIDRQQIRAWAPVVARFSGIIDPMARDSYVQRVLEVLEKGRFLHGAQNDSVPLLGPTPRPVAENSDGSTPSATIAAPEVADYPGARWLPSPYFGKRPAAPTGQVLLIVIHTCQNNYDACVGWFRDPNNPLKTSAHYIVNREGNAITQMVREADRANHIKASYQCIHNSQFSCDRNNTSTNEFTIGIEHEGYAETQRFPERQLDASAELACAIARRHGIPIQHVRFVAHGQMQGNRIDPGLAWDWTAYLRKVARRCGAPDPGVSPDRKLLGLPYK